MFKNIYRQIFKNKGNGPDNIDDWVFVRRFFLVENLYNSRNESKNSTYTVLVRAAKLICFTLVICFFFQTKYLRKLNKF